MPTFAGEIIYKGTCLTSRTRNTKELTYDSFCADTQDVDVYCHWVSDYLNGSPGLRLVVAKYAAKKRIRRLLDMSAHKAAVADSE